MLMPTHPQDVLIARLKSDHWVIHRPKVISAEVCSSITMFLMFLMHSSVKSFHKIGNVGTWGLLPLANSEICYLRKWVRISARYGRDWSGRRSPILMKIGIEIRGNAPRPRQSIRIGIKIAPRPDPDPIFVGIVSPSRYLAYSWSQHLKKTWLALTSDLGWRN